MQHKIWIKFIRWLLVALS